MTSSRRAAPRLKSSGSRSNVRLSDVWSTFRYTLWCLAHALFRLLHLNPISLILRRWRQLHHLNTRMALSIRPRLVDLATDFFLSDERRKRKLLRWVQFILPWVGEEVFDFTACWQDGIVLCALMESISPGACPRFNLLKPHHRVNNCRLGIQLAMQYLQVTQLPLSPEEMAIADEDCEVKICHLIQLLKWKYQKQGSKPKVFCNVSVDEPLPCKCHARGTGIRAGIVGRRTKFNVLTDSVSRLDLQIEIRGPNNEYNKEKIVSIHAGATARYRDHVMAAATSSPAEDDGKTKAYLLAGYQGGLSSIPMYMLWNTTGYFLIGFSPTGSQPEVYFYTPDHKGNGKRVGSPSTTGGQCLSSLPSYDMYDRKTVGDFFTYPHTPNHKVIDDGAGHSFLRQKSLDEDFGHLVIPFDYQCVGEGRFLVTYIPRSGGLHYITILSQGVHIQDSPFEVKVSDWVSSWNLVPKPRVVPFDMMQAVEEGSKDTLKPTASSDKIRCKLSHVAHVSKQLTMMKRRILKKVITHNGEEIICDVTPSPTLSRQSSADFSSDVSEDEKFSRKSRSVSSAKEDNGLSNNNSHSKISSKIMSSSRPGKGKTGNGKSVAFTENRVELEEGGATTTGTAKKSPPSPRKTVGVVSVLDAIEEVATTSSPLHSYDNNIVPMGTVSDVDSTKTQGSKVAIQSTIFLPCTIESQITQEKNDRQPNPEIIITPQLDFSDERSGESASPDLEEGYQVLISDHFSTDSPLRGDGNWNQTSQVVVSSNINKHEGFPISNMNDNVNKTDTEFKSKPIENGADTSEKMSSNLSLSNVGQTKSKTPSPVFHANDIVGSFLDSLHKGSAQKSKSLSPAFSFDEKKMMKDQMQFGSRYLPDFAACNNTDKNTETSVRKQSIVPDSICARQSSFSISEDGKIAKEGTQIIRSNSASAVDGIFCSNPREAFVGSSLGIVSNSKELTIKGSAEEETLYSHSGPFQGEQTESGLSNPASDKPSVDKDSSCTEGKSMSKESSDINEHYKNKESSILDFNPTKPEDPKGKTKFTNKATEIKTNTSEKGGGPLSGSLADDNNENRNSSEKLSPECTSETDCSSDISWVSYINDDDLSEHFRPGIKCASMDFFDYQPKHKITWSQHKSLSAERKLQKSLSYPARAESLVQVTSGKEDCKRTLSQPLRHDQSQNSSSSGSDMDKRDVDWENKENSKYSVKILKSDSMKKACYNIKSGKDQHNSSSLSNSSRSISFRGHFSFDENSRSDPDLSYDGTETLDLMTPRGRFVENKTWSTYDGNTMRHDTEDQNGINSKNSNDPLPGEMDDEILQVVIETQWRDSDPNEDEDVESLVPFSLSSGITEDISSLNEFESYLPTLEDNSPIRGQDFKLSSEQDHQIFIMSPRSATSNKSDNSDWSDNEEPNEKDSVAQNAGTEIKRLLLKGDWSPQFVDLQCHSYVKDDQNSSVQNVNSQPSLSHRNKSSLFEDKEHLKEDNDTLLLQRLSPETIDIQTATSDVHGDKVHIKNSVSEKVAVSRVENVGNGNRESGKKMSFKLPGFDKFKFSTGLKENNQNKLQDTGEIGLGQDCNNYVHKKQPEELMYPKKRQRPVYQQNSTHLEESFAGDKKGTNLEEKSKFVNNEVNNLETTHENLERLCKNQSSSSHADLCNLSSFFSTLGLFSPAVSEIIPFNNSSTLKNSFVDELYDYASHYVDVFSSCPLCRDAEIYQVHETHKEFPDCLNYFKERSLTPTKFRKLKVLDQRHLNSMEQSAPESQNFTMKPSGTDVLFDNNAYSVELSDNQNIDDELENVYTFQEYGEAKQRTLTPTKYRINKKNKAGNQGRDVYGRKSHDAHNRSEPYRKSYYDKESTFSQTSQSYMDASVAWHQRSIQDGHHISEIQSFSKFPFELTEPKHCEDSCGQNNTQWHDPLEMALFSPSVSRYRTKDCDKFHGHQNPPLHRPHHYEPSENSISDDIPIYAKKRRLLRNVSDISSFQDYQPHLINNTFNANKIPMKFNWNKNTFKQRSGKEFHHFDKNLSATHQTSFQHLTQLPPVINQAHKVSISHVSGDQEGNKEYFADKQQFPHPSNQHDSSQLQHKQQSYYWIGHNNFQQQQLQQQQNRLDNQWQPQRTQKTFVEHQPPVPFLHKGLCMDNTLPQNKDNIFNNQHDYQFNQPASPHQQRQQQTGSIYNQNALSLPHHQLQQKLLFKQNEPHLQPQHNHHPQQQHSQKHFQLQYSHSSQLEQSKQIPQKYLLQKHQDSSQQPPQQLSIQHSKQHSQQQDQHSRYQLPQRNSQQQHCNQHSQHQSSQRPQQLHVHKSDHQPEPPSQTEPVKNSENVVGVLRRQSTVDTFDSGITEDSSHMSLHMSHNDTLDSGNLSLGDHSMFSFYLPMS